MTMPEIRDLVPHGGAMSLLDRLLHADDESACAEVKITRDSLFFDGSGVGAWVGIEYMAQTIAAHAGYGASLRGEAVKSGFLLGSRRYQSSVPVFRLDSVLHIHVQRVLWGESGLGSFECRIDDQAGSSTIATATVTVFQPQNVNDFLLRSSE